MGTESLLYVGVWVFASVLVGLVIGFYMGRSSHAAQDKTLIEKERAATLTALTTLLRSAEQLTDDVGTHSTEIREVGRHVSDLELPPAFEEVQRELLGQISGMMRSNQRLEEDLQYSRYRMEQQAEEIDRTRIEARTDALSGTSNRKAFDERLQYLVINLKRQGEPFTLVLADVDKFKWVNDTHGHPAGDRVVQQVGTFLKQTLRTGDFVARYGGDEFALLLPQTNAWAGEQVAERLRQLIARNNFEVASRGERVSVTLSVGVVHAAAGDGPESLLGHADTALYKSKQSGRNQTHAFHGLDSIVKVQLGDRPDEEGIADSFDGEAQPAGSAQA